MKQTVNIYTFREAFQAMRPDNFSYEGLEALYGYLTTYEEVSGEEMELDVIALCCEYSEDTPKNIAYQYNIDLAECETPEEIEAAVIEFLNFQDVMVDVGGKLSDSTRMIVYRNF